NLATGPVRLLAAWFVSSFQIVNAMTLSEVGGARSAFRIDSRIGASCRLMSLSYRWTKRFGRTVRDVELVENRRGLVQDLSRHLDRRQQRIKIQRREMLGAGHRNHLVVYETKEVLNRLQLRFDSFYRALHVVIGFQPELKKLEVCSVKPPRVVVGCACDRPLGLLNLVLDRLPVYRTHVMLASPVGIQKIHVLVPHVIQLADVVGQLERMRALLVVLVDLILEPAQVLDGFAFARIEAGHKLAAVSVHLGELFLPHSLVDG